MPGMARAGSTLLGSARPRAAPHQAALRGGGTSKARTTYGCALTVTMAPSAVRTLTTRRNGTGGLPHSAPGRPAASIRVLGCHQRCRTASARRARSWAGRRAPCIAARPALNSVCARQLLRHRHWPLARAARSLDTGGLLRAGGCARRAVQRRPARDIGLIRADDRRHGHARRAAPLPRRTLKTLARALARRAVEPLARLAGGAGPLQAQRGGRAARRLLAAEGGGAHGAGRAQRRLSGRARRRRRAPAARRRLRTGARGAQAARPQAPTVRARHRAAGRGAARTGVPGAGNARLCFTACGCR